LVDQDTLMRDVVSLSGPEAAGRYAGSDGSKVAQRYLTDRFQQIGATTVPGFGWKWSYAAILSLDERYDGTNLMAVVRGDGTAPGWIVLSAHYDPLGIVDGKLHPGADDNASGVAAVLAIAELARREPLRHDLLVLLFDGEERELSGSRAWIDDPPIPRSEIVLNVNLDMVARGDDGNLWVTRSPQLRSTGALEGLAAQVPICLRFGHDGTDERVDWTGQGDHYHFARHRIPFAYFGVEDHDDYHRPTDTPDRIDSRWFAASVETIATALRALDAELAVGASAAPSNP
jgi:Zn-dependent M28 family amino/carboxypeptidase